MNIFVFVKQVPDTEARIRVNSQSNGIVSDDITFMDSPYDEYAVEEAIKTAEGNPGSTVTAVTIGPERAVSLLRDDLAKGVNEAFHIKTDDYGDYDALTTSKIIAAFLKDKKYDLIFFGNKAYGSDNSLVPSMTAALLNIPAINITVKMKIEGGKVVAERQVEGMTEIVEAQMPCVISAQKGLNEPRIKSLKGIMAAKKKEIPTLTIDKLGLNTDDLKKGLNLLNISAPQAKSKGKIIELEPEAAAKELADYLKNELKMI
jgi:electron transfer flavoprotein beta subunit